MFKNRLKIIRGILGLTQTQLAKRCGLSASSISYFEHGRREPSLHNLIKLCKALPCSCDILLGLDYDDDDDDEKVVQLKSTLEQIQSLNQKIPICDDGEIVTNGCKHFPYIYVGSQSCIKCHYCTKYSLKEQWVICSKVN